MPAPPVSSSVEFVSTCEPESLCLGFTKFRGTDVPGSTVEGLDQNFQAGVEAELLFCPKTSEGEIRNISTQIVWKYTCVADQVRSLERSDEQGELFLAKFLAKVPGTYKMEVKINGQKLAKSPFSFPEKVRELNIIGKLDFP